MVKVYFCYEEGVVFGLVVLGEVCVCFDNFGKLLLVGVLE